MQHKLGTDKQQDVYEQTHKAMSESAEFKTDEFKQAKTPSSSIADPN